MPYPPLVPIRRLDPRAVLPTFGTPHSAGFDLYTIEDHHLPANDAITYVRTGLVIKTPPGHMLMIALRSSTPRAHNVTMPHGVGIVDQDYCGDGDEILVPVQRTDLFMDGAHIIPAGTRLAQGVFVPILSVFSWEPVTRIGEPDRGGFGSTNS